MKEIQPDPSRLEEALALLCVRIRLLLRQHSTCPEKRILIALAGVPGSGKSTVSAGLLQALRKDGADDIVIVPMDGFHHPKRVLATFGDPVMAFRKRGAPFTFDATGLLDLVMRLKTTPRTTIDEPEVFITAPSFDHAVQDPVLNDIHISSRTQVVIIEGNYTLLDEDPWNKIAQLVDERWFVDVPADVACERLAKRHLQAGIETSKEAAVLRAEDNDLPNGEYIRAKLIEPDIILSN
ncbi:phosphoribulokinase/uridine kinase [Xylariaceae sp. FL0804]|nr:phosphoribulokinase/uridine kinase [Xylariaceae sp. FL0804]